MSDSPTRPSLKSIAEKSGVSISLVSKVLNNRLGNTGVGDDLAEKIRETARELGYRKNMLAQSLRTGRHDTIGVILHRHGEPGSPLIENLTIGISGVAREHHQRLLLSFFETDEEFLEMSKSAHWGLMDGLILGGLVHHGLKEKVLEIQRTGLPVVSIFEDAMDRSIVNVGLDQEEVTRLATRHLLERGCQKIGMVRSHPDRHKGYRRAHREAGKRVDSQMVFTAREVPFHYSGGEQAVEHWIAAGTIPDGIVTDSDSQAMAAINTLHNHGLRVPTDVKVTGVDNSAFCDYARPSITSVSQENLVRGARAMELMMDMANGGRCKHDHVLPRLVIRESSGGA